MPFESIQKFHRASAGARTVPHPSSGLSNALAEDPEIGGNVFIICVKRIPLTEAALYKSKHHLYGRTRPILAIVVFMTSITPPTVVE
jgi:hypothetical protein